MIEYPPLTWTVMMPSHARVEAGCAALWQVMNEDARAEYEPWERMVAVGYLDRSLERIRHRVRAVLIAAEGVE